MRKNPTEKNEAGQVAHDPTKAPAFQRLVKTLVTTPPKPHAAKSPDQKRQTLTAKAEVMTATIGDAIRLLRALDMMPREVLPTDRREWVASSVMKIVDCAFPPKGASERDEYRE